MAINQRKAGVILSYILTITNALVSFIYIPLIIYFLGKEEYGLYQLIGSFLVYLSLFDFGLGKTVTRYYSKFLALKDRKSNENLLALTTLIFLIFAIVVLLIGGIFYFYLENIFDNSLSVAELEIAKKMYLVVLVTAAFTILTNNFKAVITAHERFVFLKSIMIIQVIIRPIVVFAIFLIEANALILVIIQAFLNIAVILLMIYFVFKKLKVKIKLHNFDIPFLKELLRYSFFIFITAMMDQIFWRSDQIILGILVGTASVAVYSIGSQIIMNYMTLSTAISGVFLPSVTKKVTQNVSNKELTNLLVRIGRLQYILLGAVFLGFILYGKEFLALWVGDGFIDAYYITIIIMIPFTVDLIQNIGLTILQAKNMYEFRALVLFVMAILNIIISIPLAIYYGGIGTAVATGISFLIGNGIIMNIYYHKRVGLNIITFWKEIIKISVCMIIPFVTGLLINNILINNLIISFIIKLLLFIIVYVIIMWVLCMNKYEKGLIKKPLKVIFK